MIQRKIQHPSLGEIEGLYILFISFQGFSDVYKRSRDRLHLEIGCNTLSLMSFFARLIYSINIKKKHLKRDNSRM